MKHLFVFMYVRSPSNRVANIIFYSQTGCYPAHALANDNLFICCYYLATLEFTKIKDYIL